MPVRLALVISGLVAGGSPGCRIVLCCFTHFPGVAIFVMAFLCSGVCVWLPPYPDRVDTMLSPLRSLLDVLNWPADHTLSLCCWFSVFVVLWWFSVLFVLSIHRSCNMQLNVLNDLAEAKRRKKKAHQPFAALR